MNKLIIVLLLAGCTIEGGGVVEGDLNKQMTCTDFRDGEVFTFNTNNITSTRIGFGVSPSVRLIDDSGRERAISDDMDYLKCEEQS